MKKSERNAIIKWAESLTDEELETVRKHPVIAAKEILEPISNVQDIIPIIEHHHENWDGSGYPKGLKEQEIPLSAQIVGVVGSFCALTEDRTYRDKYSELHAWNIMEQDALVKYNPDLFRILKKIARQLR